MEKLFSYGTLQLPQVQMDTFGRYLEGKKDILQGYKLEEVEINDPEVIKSSGKNIHPMLVFTGNKNDEITGVLFKITKEELAQADKYEVSAYKRVKEVFKSGTSGWVYVENK